MGKHEINRLYKTILRHCVVCAFGCCLLLGLWSCFFSLLLFCCGVFFLSLLIYLSLSSNIEQQFVLCSEILHVSLSQLWFFESVRWWHVGYCVVCCDILSSCAFWEILTCSELICRLIVVLRGKKNHNNQFVCRSIIIIGPWENQSQIWSSDFWLSTNGVRFPLFCFCFFLK